MGKASRKKGRIATTAATTADASAAQPSTVLVGGACLAIAILAAVPYGPFHALPAVMLWPLLAILFLVLMARTPLMAGRLPTRVPIARIAEAAALTVILLTWALLKLVGLHASGTDDNIYFYMAARMADGAVPYRDFFFSHPPVHLLVPAAIFKVFGFSVGLAKLIPVMAQTIAALFLYLTLRRSSTTLALIGLLTHLLAYQILMGSTDMNGENIMTMFLWVSVWAATGNRPILAGVMAALATGTGIYALAGVLTAGVIAFCHGIRRGLLFLAGWVGLTIIGLILFRLIGGPDFTAGVFTYHTQKQVRGTGHMSIFENDNLLLMPRIMFANLGAFLKGGVFQKTIYYHGAIFFLAASGFVVGLANGRLRGFKFDATNQAHLALASSLSLLLFLFQWASVNEVYDFYLVPMISLMVPAAACAANRALQGITTASRPGHLAIPAVILAVAWLAVPISVSINARLWPEEQAARGQKVSYEWRDPAILKGPAHLTKALFFKDSRERGTVTPFYRHYMWNKMLTFSSVDEIAAYVRDNTQPDDTITGASTLAPLVALKAGRRMAGDEADTNAKRFNSGMLSEQDFVDRICGDGVKMLISAENSYFGQKRMSSSRTLSTMFEPDRQFKDGQLKHFKQFPISVYRLRQGAGCGRK